MKLIVDSVSKNKFNCVSEGIQEPNFIIQAQQDSQGLFHAKSILQRASINGKVKSRFKAHHDLFMTLGK